MAITTVNETFKNRAPVQTLDGKTYIRSFEVQTNDPTDGGFEIFKNADIPNPGDPHNKDTQATCTKVTPMLKSESGDGCFWLVKVDYTTASKVSGSTTDQDVDPVSLPPDISFGYNQYQHVTDRAYEGPGISAPTADIGDPTIPIVNSAYQPFDPPPTTEISKRVIRIVRNEDAEDYNADDLDTYNNTLNQTEMTIAGITLAFGEGRIRNLPATLEYKPNGDVYYQVTYEIEVDRKKHFNVLLDRGFYEFSAGDYTKIVDEDGDLVAEPVMLDGSGNKLSDPSSDDAVYRTYRVFKYKKWDPLKLPVDDGGSGVVYEGLGGLGDL